MGVQLLGSASEGGVPLIVSITLSRVGLQKSFRAVNCSRHTSFCRHPRFHPGRLESGHVGFLFVSNSKQRRNKRSTPPPPSYPPFSTRYPISKELIRAIAYSRVTSSSRGFVYTALWLVECGAKEVCLDGEGRNPFRACLVFV